MHRITQEEAEIPDMLEEAAQLVFGGPSDLPRTSFLTFIEFCSWLEIERAITPVEWHRQITNATEAAPPPTPPEVSYLGPDAVFRFRLDMAMRLHVRRSFLRHMISRCAEVVLEFARVEDLPIFGRVDQADDIARIEPRILLRPYVYDSAIDGLVFSEALARKQRSTFTEIDTRRITDLRVRWSDAMDLTAKLFNWPTAEVVELSAERAKADKSVASSNAKSGHRRSRRLYQESDTPLAQEALRLRDVHGYSEWKAAGAVAERAEGVNTTFESKRRRIYDLMSVLETAGPPT